MIRLALGRPPTAISIADSIDPQDTCILMVLIISSLQVLPIMSRKCNIPEQSIKMAASIRRKILGIKDISSLKVVTIMHIRTRG
jgi:hypothetical protein